MRDKQKQNAYKGALKKFNKSWTRTDDHDNAVFTHKAGATVWVLNPDSPQLPSDALGQIKDMDFGAMRNLPGVEFLKALAKFASTENGRYPIAHVEIEWGDEHIRMTAADGRHLASHVFTKERNSKISKQVKKFNVPAAELAHVADVIKTAARGADYVKCGILPTTRTVYDFVKGKGNIERQEPTWDLVLVGKPAFNGIQVAARLCNRGEWPDWRAIRPATERQFMLPDGFCAAIESVGTVRDVANLAVRVEIAGDNCTLRARNIIGVMAEWTEKGRTAKDSTKRGDMAIGLDPVYVKHCADLVASRGINPNVELEIKYIDKNHGVELCWPDAPAHSYHLVMPVYL